MASLTMLALLVSLGPLVSKGPGDRLHDFCSAFAWQDDSGKVWMGTAGHCLKTPTPKLWFPGLEGNVGRLRESAWTQVHALGSDTWQRSNVADLARVAAPDGVSAPRRGTFPKTGDALHLMGYPGGEGPVMLTCHYAGVVLAPPVHQPRIRPSVRCAKGTSVRLQGMSGGPVVNATGDVVGAVVSGVLDPEGGVLPGFEPLAEQWLINGWSSYPYVGLPGEGHVLEVYARAGQVLEYRVRLQSGLIWEQWKAPVAGLAYR